MGSLAIAAIMFASSEYAFGTGAVGANILAIGEAKTSLGFLQAIMLGILCNMLVCLAVWLTYSGRTTTDKILAIIAPIACFVAAGFEHSVANMYFIPMALLVKNFASPAFFLSIHKLPDGLSQPDGAELPCWATCYRSPSGISSGAGFSSA